MQSPKQVYIIEGIDNTGKTTYIRKLEELYPITIIQVLTAKDKKQIYNNKNLYNDWEYFVNAIVHNTIEKISFTNTRDIIVFDRWFLSTLAYQCGFQQNKNSCENDILEHAIPWFFRYFNKSFPLVKYHLIYINPDFTILSLIQNNSKNMNSSIKFDNESLQSLLKIHKAYIYYLGIIESMFPQINIYFLNQKDLFSGEVQIWIPK